MLEYQDNFYRLVQQKNHAELKNCLNSLPNNLKGPAFEWLLRELYEGNGWFAVTKGQTADRGADILLYHPKAPNKVALIVQAKNYRRPLTFDQTKIELVKFEDKATPLYNCNQFRLVAVNNFVNDSYGLEEWNMELAGWDHVVHLIDRLDPNKKLIPEINLFPHNRLTYQNIITLWNDNREVAVIQATGTGKSYLISKVMGDLIDKKKLLLAPTNYILEQQKQLVPWAMSSTISMTYAKCTRLTQEEIDNLKPNLIILDEYHRCGADEWGAGVNKILDTHTVAKVLGTTATPVRYLDNNRDMSEELFQGIVANNLPLTDAIARKILPEPHYICALYTLQEEVEGLTQKIKESAIPTQDKKKAKADIDKARINWESTFGIINILKKHLPPEINKIIVFCQNQEHLDQMEVEVQRWFQKSGIYKFRSVYRVYSSYPNSDHELNSFRNTKRKNTIHILFAIDMLNEGLHISDVGAVLLLRPTASPIIFYQQIGRCIQINADNNPIIFDLVNNFKNIRSNDFFSDLDKSINSIQSKRTALGLKPHHFNLYIHDETKKVRAVLNEISNRLQPWETGLANLKSFVTQFGHSKVPRLYITDDDFNLGQWVAVRRHEKKRRLLAQERVAILESFPGWAWIVQNEDIWNEGIECLKEYITKYGHAAVPQNYITSNGFKLGIWVSKHRSKYKQNKLPEKKVKILEGITGWLWDVMETGWQEGFEHLQAYVNENGHANVPAKYTSTDGYKLGRWVSKRRYYYKDGKLPQDRAQTLEKLPGWDWGSFSHWQVGLKQLNLFVKQHGHALVPNEYKTPDDFDLGQWVEMVRDKYHNVWFPKGKIKTLERLIGWSWDPLPYLTTNALIALIKFVEKNGHSKVPYGYRTGYRTENVVILDNWVKKWRQNYKINKSSKNQSSSNMIRILENLPGWTWEL